MRKNRIILLILFVNIFCIGLITCSQQSECEQGSTANLYFGEFAFHEPTVGFPHSEKIPTVVKYSFSIRDNPDVDITVRITDYYWINDSGVKITYRSTPEGGYGSYKEYSESRGYIVFWHLDYSHQFDDVSMSIKIDVTPFYYNGRMIPAYYFGFLFFIGFVLVTFMYPLHEYQKKKSQQENETILLEKTKQDTITDPLQEDTSQLKLKTTETWDIFCWKCGQPNKNKTIYCASCGSDIHNPES